MEGALGIIDPKFNILFFIIFHVIVSVIMFKLNRIEITTETMHLRGFEKDWIKVYIGIPLLLFGFLLNKSIKRGDKDIKKPFTSIKLHISSALLAFTILESLIISHFGFKNHSNDVSGVLSSLYIIIYLVYSYFSPKNKPQKRELIGIMISLFSKVLSGIALLVETRFNFDIKQKQMVKSCIYIGLYHIMRALKIILIDYIIHNIPVSGGVQMGFQSIYSILLSVLIYIPMNYRGLTSSNEGDGYHEDLYDSFLMAKSNPTIIFYLIMLVIMVFFSSLFQSTTIQCFNGFYIILSLGLCEIIYIYFWIYTNYKLILNFCEVLRAVFSIGYIIGCLIYANIIPIFNDEIEDILDTSLIKV